MRESNISTITAARRAVDLVIAASDLDRNPVPYFEPTNLSGLPEPLQERELAAKEENEQANRIRAASHLCLSAASDSLAAALALSRLSIDLVPQDRELQLLAIAAHAKAASERAASAAGVLMGDMAPPSDDSLVVSRARP